jgi:hypothetical protein
MSIIDISYKAKLHAAQLKSDHKAKLKLINTMSADAKKELLIEVMKDRRMKELVDATINEFSKLSSAQALIAFCVYEQWEAIGIMNISPEEIANAIL